jgi:hypothetical protein
MRASTLTVCCFFAFFGVVNVFADRGLPNQGPPPKPASATSEPVRLVVKPDRTAKTSRIIIPAKFLPAGVAGENVGALSPTRSIIAGVALSAAIAGVFIAVRRGHRVGAVAATILGTLVFIAAASAIADVPVTPEERLGPQIVVEVVAEGDEIVLVQAPNFGR